MSAWPVDETVARAPRAVSAGDVRAALKETERLAKQRSPSRASCRRVVQCIRKMSVDADDAAQAVSTFIEHALLHRGAAAQKLLASAESTLRSELTPVGQLHVTKAAYLLARRRQTRDAAVEKLIELREIATRAYEPADGQLSSILSWITGELRTLGDNEFAQEVEFEAATARNASSHRVAGLALAKSRDLIPGAQEEKAVPVTVHFATNRTVTPAGLTHPYGNTVGSSISFGTARVIVPLDANLERIRTAVRCGRPGFLRRVAFKRGKTELDIVWPQPDEAVFWRDFRLTVTKRERREVLIYIHGFNTSFERALERAAHLHVALEVQGATMAFSWPSLGNLVSYREDAAMMRYMPYEAIIQCIRNAVDLSGAKLVHIIAHSMGARLALRGLGMLAGRKEQLPGGAKLGHIVLAAADVKRREYLRAIETVSSLAERITLYASKNDLALRVARYYDGAWRAGDARNLTLAASSDTVDTTRSSGGFVGHSDFDGTALDDLRALLWFGIPPERRDFLEGRRSLAGRSWRFRRLGLINRELLWCRSGHMVARLAGCEQALAMFAAAIGKLDSVKDKRLHTDLSRASVACHAACSGRVSLQFEPEERADVYRH